MAVFVVVSKPRIVSIFWRVCPCYCKPPNNLCRALNDVMSQSPSFVKKVAAMVTWNLSGHKCQVPEVPKQLPKLLLNEARLECVAMDMKDENEYKM